MSSLLLTIAVSAASAADTGAKFATTAEAPNSQWADAANALGSNTGDFMTSATSGHQQGFGTFGLGIPNGSIIDGITVSVSAKSTDSSGCRIQVQLSGAGGASLTSAKNGNLTDTLQDVVFGSATDTWGRVWDPTETTNGNFRVVVTNNDPGSACVDGSTTSVDTVTVLVTYRTIDQHQVDNAALSSSVCDQADFNFIIDMSGSIGAQGNAPSNLPQIKDGINAFVTAFQAGGDGIYSGTTFNGTSANDLTSGYVSASSFLGDVNGLSGPTGSTPTAAGIDTGAANNANDRAGVPNIMFVLTDGSPNVPGGNLSDPPTWLQAANAAIGAADDARTGHYVVKAVYLSTANDPGDTTLPFSNPDGDSAWATAVMTQIGAGSYLPADFTSFVDDLFKAIHCTPPAETSISTSASDDVTTGGVIHDTATLSGATDGAGGSIRFDLYGPNDANCSESIFNSTVDVNGNGKYDSAAFTTDTAGTYRWIASYSGDNANMASAGSCGDNGESVVVSDPLVPHIDVTKLVATDDSEFGPTSQAIPGDVLHFQITIHNSGTGAATGVNVSDDISDAVAHGTYNSDCSPACDHVGNVLSWSDLSIAAGDSAVLSYSVTLDNQFPAGTTIIPNTVVVVGPGSNCPDQSQLDVAAPVVDPACSTTTTVGAAPHISATKLVQDGEGPFVHSNTAQPGDILTWKITITNDGNAPVTPVLHAEDIAQILLHAKYNNDCNGGCDFGSGHILTWLLSSLDANGGSVTLTFSVTLDSTFPVGTTAIPNTVVVEDSNCVPDFNNDSDCTTGTTVTVQSEPTPPPTDAIAGGSATSSGVGLLILLALLGSIIVGVSYVTPARVANRRKTGR